MIHASLHLWVSMRPWARLVCHSHVGCLLVGLVGLVSARAVYASGFETRRTDTGT